MDLSRSSLKLWVLQSISLSYAPFKIGLRRKSIFDQVIQRFKLTRVPITNDDKNNLNMRLQRMFKSLVQEGLIKKDSKGHQQTFYLLEKDAFRDYLEYLEECTGKEWDREEYEKNFRQAIINRSDYLKLPEYWDMIPITDILQGDIPYEKFRSIIMDIAIEVLDPQIRVQYDLMKGGHDPKLVELWASAFRKAFS